MIQSFIECRPEINVGMLCGQRATGASGSVHAYLPRRSLESRPRRGSANCPGGPSGASGVDPTPGRLCSHSGQAVDLNLAAQAGPFGIRVNCIAPETILTERNQREIPNDIQAKLLEAHPIRRLGTPEDVANAALFLATNNSSWISGIVVDVAGGSVLV